jgi:hypothetical protein
MRRLGDDSDDDFFGDEIFRYTRQDAIRDGYLLDISTAARARADLKLPSAITLGLWEALARGEKFNPHHPAVMDLCDGVAFAAAGLTSSEWFDREDGGTLFFTFKSCGRKLSAKFVLGPGDDAMPVVTIMLPGED